MVSVIQDWVNDLSFMQQTVVLELLRGPDGLTKYHKSKFLLRWFRRCVLISAFDKRVLKTPYEHGGGSFTGPSFPKSENFDQTPASNFGKYKWEREMFDLVNEVIRGADELPHHFYRHMMHSFEILGYKHPDKRIREFWCAVYSRLAKDMHLTPETEIDMDKRLGDNREDWISFADEATLS